MRSLTIALTAIVLVACTSPSLALPKHPQYKLFEFTPTIGYQFGGGVLVSNGEVQIKDASNIGFTFDYRAMHDLMYEFWYSKQETRTVLKEYPFGTESDLWATTISYYHGGIQYLIARGQPVEPFVTATAGLTHISPKNAGLDSETRFSFGMGAGVKMISKSGIGFKVSGKLLITMLWGAAGVWVGPGGGGISLTGSGFGQGDVNAGLVLAF